ncbi:MAG: DrmB family protein, partial [bacterium]
VRHFGFLSSRSKKKSLAGLMNVWKDDQGNPYNSALARIGLDDEKTNKFSPSNPNNVDTNPQGQFCKGHRPWLGTKGINNAQACGEHLQVLIRGGSNVHYSDIVSSLYLPEYSESVTDETIKGIIELFGLEYLRTAYNQNENSFFILKMVIAPYKDFQSGVADINKVLPLLVEEIKKDTNTPASSTEINSYCPLTLRKGEYDYILKGRDSENSDFKAVIKELKQYEDASFLKKYFEKVVLVEKLKETRVFRSFARINPNNRIDKSELSSKPVKWLPAYQVSGEGIFLKFRDEAIDMWLSKENSEFRSLMERYRQAMNRRNSNYLENPKDINSAFVMMHTFAHLLIKRLCYSCGYGSSALRERIYFSSDPENRMNGLLIYTSSGDSEGSLGGLVRQGSEPFLANIVRQAIEEARWCSADPVCSDIGQSSGQGPDNVNGSACHNCCLVPETSCEEFNMLLDRATISGTINNPEFGFFSL